MVIQLVQNYLSNLSFYIYNMYYITVANNMYHKVC